MVTTFGDVSERGDEMLNLINPTELEKRKDAQGCVVFSGGDVRKICDELLELFPHLDLDRGKLVSSGVVRAVKKGRHWIWSHGELKLEIRFPLGNELRPCPE